ncbi:SO2930 family diheme c-type cytochrome [Algoriphagus hitonicola]|uniref:Uncharacterized protein n=1 Tax=Algoriphagus hitonicola TaxID=435880 RepID=A0A1I2V7L5_9BACT|nr:SO2930 family diheme c-type cytochrome [Algoriphagus hitonicola]SFG85242.1 conserved hypothetical protein, HNE_0200 family [Algoriphagus hitonicola]
MYFYKGKIETSLVLLGFIAMVNFSCQNPKTEIPKAEEILKEELVDGNFPYQRLSTYGFFQGDLKNLSPSSEVIFYQPASSLFTDYAQKSRFVWIPEEKKVKIESDELNLPLGSMLIKNFFYPEDFRKPNSTRKIIETRIMIHQENGWEAFPYVWNDTQTDAVLKIAGGKTTVAFTDQNGEDQIINYLIPNKNQCKSCHNKNEKLTPIGISVAYLNTSLDEAGQKANQLEKWTELEKLEGFMGEENHPQMVNYEDKNQSLELRARAYLDINCAHCHRAEGPASTSGLFLTYDESNLMKLGIRKTPVAAGAGAGNFTFDILPGKAEESILLHRMNSTEVGIAMPEIGRTTVDKEGIELISNWINSIQD